MVDWRPNTCVGANVVVSWRAFCSFVVAAADIVVEEGVADSSSADPAVVALADAEKEVGLPGKHSLHWGQQEQEPGFPPPGELQRDRTTLAW